MPDVTLHPFSAADLRAVLPWFADPAQREFAANLPARELRLLRTMPGTSHRGALILSRHAWVARDEAGIPVAFAGAEVYDRPPHLDAHDHPRRPAPTWSGTTAGLMLCVDPARWNHGYGRATLRALTTASELSSARWLEAGIEQADLASAHCAAAAGFVPAADEPDDEGMVSWIRPAE